MPGSQSTSVTRERGGFKGSSEGGGSRLVPGSCCMDGARFPHVGLCEGLGCRAQLRGGLAGIAFEQARTSVAGLVPSRHPSALGCRAAKPVIPKPGRRTEYFRCPERCSLPPPLSPVHPSPGFPLSLPGPAVPDGLGEQQAEQQEKPLCRLPLQSGAARTFPFPASCW